MMSKKRIRILKSMWYDANRIYLQLQNCFCGTTTLNVEKRAKKWMYAIELLLLEVEN